MTKEIPTVAVLAFDKEKVLLVKHGEKAEHLTGAYGLPGGRIQVGENFKSAAAREFEEETGLKSLSDLIPLQTIFHADIPRKSGEIVKMSWHVFVTNNVSGKLKLSGETEPEWVEIEKVSGLNLLPNTKQAIEEGLKL